MRRCHPLLIVVLLTPQVSQAAFIVEAHESGLAFDNFEFGEDTTMSGESIPSTAIGLQATNSIYGGDGIEFPDTYVFLYRPGRDADNFSPASGTILGSTDGSPGDGFVASGLAGGTSGAYNIYITSPASVNVSGVPTSVTITQDGEDVIIDDLDQNSGKNGLEEDSQINNRGPFVGGMNNAWLQLASVELLAGQTYTVTMEAGSNTFVSQRVHGIMWELAASFPLGDFDRDGQLTATDIDQMTVAIVNGVVEARFDLNSDGQVNLPDRTVWVENLKGTWFGDSNLDGQFNSNDFVSVFQKGEYEDGLIGNSTWRTGDWNGDLEFNSTDFVIAFQSGGYEKGPRPEAFAVPEPSMMSALGILLLCFFAHQRKPLFMIREPEFSESADAIHIETRYNGQPSTVQAARQRKNRNVPPIGYVAADGLGQCPLLTGR